MKQVRIRRPMTTVNRMMRNMYSGGMEESSAIIHNHIYNSFDSDDCKRAMYIKRILRQEYNAIRYAVERTLENDSYSYRAISIPL